MSYHASMTGIAIGRPQSEEFAEWQSGYIGQVGGGDLMRELEQASEGAVAFFRGIDEAKSAYRYAPGKWSIKQVLGHIIDAERIFGYRALRVARGDATPLAPFEQDDYVATAHSDERRWSDLVDEFEWLRRSHVLMFRVLSAEDWVRRGTVSGATVSARAMGYVLTGHELHHRKILAERYLAARPS